MLNMCLLCISIQYRCIQLVVYMFSHCKKNDVATKYINLYSDCLLNVYCQVYQFIATFNCSFHLSLVQYMYGNSYF